MFLNTCTGCVQVPTPMYYWNPYVVPGYSKKPRFQISDILHLTQSSSAIHSTILSKNGVIYDPTKARGSGGFRSARIEAATGKGDHTHLKSREHQAAVLNFCVKDTHKCSVPSALEPLQALCTAGPRGYRESSPEKRNKSSDTVSSQIDLKFGISKILSDGFGKEKQNKGR